jgi:arylsulfatase A-like enzyme
LLFATAVVVIAWAVMASWAVPALIEAAYNERSVPLINDILSGRDIHSLDTYLSLWRRMAGAITIAGVLAALAGSIVWVFRDRLRKVTAPVAGAIRIGLTPAETILFATGSGILWGLLEAIRRLGWSMIIDSSSGETYVDQIWMAPIVGAVVLIVIAVLVVAIAAAIRSRWPLDLVPPAAVFIASYSLVRSTGMLHPTALTVLSIGLAVTVVRALRGRGTRTRHTIAVRGSAAMLAVFAAVLIGVNGGRRALEEWRLSRLPDTGGNQPNVLLLILDTVRAQSLGVYGYDRNTTPVLDRLAPTGTVFDWTWATAPWTLPSHASIFTGRWAQELATDFTLPLDDTYPTLAEVLQRHGYATGGFVGNVLRATRTSGLDRGFVHYEEHPASLSQFLVSTWLTRRMLERWEDRQGHHHALVQKQAGEINASLLEWIDNRVDGRPFLAFVNYFDAHNPYSPPAPFDTLFLPPEGQYWIGTKNAGGLDYEPKELDELTRAYDGGIAYIDHEIGVLLDELERRNLRDNTLIIVTSDHGEQFGDRAANLVNHANSLYTPLLRVPLIISFPPAVPAGVRIDEPVSIRDLAVTIFDLVGIDEDRFPGTVLGDLWTPANGESPSADRLLLAELSDNPCTDHPVTVPIGRGPMVSVTRGNWHFIRNGDGVEEIYDVRADPIERGASVQSVEGRAEEAELRTAMDSLLSTLTPGERPESSIRFRCPGR